MGVAVSKISMLTHCQALTQACNYCEGQSSAEDQLRIMIRDNIHSKGPLNDISGGDCLCVFVFSVLGETLVNVLDCKKDMGMWHGVLTVRLNKLYCISSLLYLFSLWYVAQCDIDKMCIFPECHEQNPHHHSAICCHESMSHVLGAEGPHPQRFSQCPILLLYSVFVQFYYFIVYVILYIYI